MSLALLFPGQGVQYPGMLPWLNAAALAQPALGALSRCLGTGWQERLADEDWASSNAVASSCFLGTACCCFMGIPPLQGFARKRLGIRIFFHTRQGAGDRCGGIRKAN